MSLLCDCRILIIFADGFIALWAIQESKAVFTIGNSGSMTQLSSQETKTVTSACWVCPFGSKVAVGYDTGDIFIYNILSNSDLGSGSPASRDSGNTHNIQTFKINLSYRLEKVPITSLKCVYSDGKANRLYVTGASDATSTNLVQVFGSTPKEVTGTLPLMFHIYVDDCVSELIGLTDLTLKIKF